MKPRIISFFPTCETLITPHVTSNVLSGEGIAITSRTTHNKASEKSYLAKSFCIFIGKGSVEGEGIARVSNLCEGTDGTCIEMVKNYSDLIESPSTTVQSREGFSWCKFQCCLGLRSLLHLLLHLRQPHLRCCCHQTWGR